MLAAGGAYAAATGNLDSFAGGLVGGFAGSMVGNSFKGSSSDIKMSSLSDDELAARYNDVKTDVLEKATAAQKLILKANSPAALSKNSSAALIKLRPFDAGIPKIGSTLDSLYNGLASVNWRQIQAYSSLVVGGASIATMHPTAIAGGTGLIGNGVAYLASIYSGQAATFSESLSGAVSQLVWKK